MKKPTMYKECNCCGKLMRLDDTDFNFKGNYDNYCVCDDCDTRCVEVVRYGKIIREIWNKE